MRSLLLSPVLDIVEEKIFWTSGFYQGSEVHQKASLTAWLFERSRETGLIISINDLFV